MRNRARQFKPKPFTSRTGLRRRIPINQMRLFRRSQPGIRSLVSQGRGTTPEIKAITTLNGSETVSLSTTATFTLLNDVVEGSGFYNRIGRRITMKSVYINGLITRTLGNAAVTTEDYVRIMVIFDRQANGAFPANTDVLRDSNRAGTQTTTALSGVNLNYRERFVILADIRVYLPPLGIAGVNPANTLLSPDPNIEPFKISRFIKLKGLQTLYDDSTGGIADISTGSLFLMTYANVTAVANAGWNFSFNARMRYWDV